MRLRLRPCLPPAGSPEADYMKQQAMARTPHPGNAFQILLGYQTAQAPLPATGLWWTDQDLPAFVFQSAAGVQIGDGRLDHAGLAHIYGSIFIKHYVFVHFFSGYRRTRDLHSILDEAQLPGNAVLYTISVDLCMQRAHADLAHPLALKWWQARAASGQVLGCGGGPPCETYTAARAQEDDGPRMLRDREHPAGIPALKAREWDQLDIGSRLMNFLQHMLVMMIRVGGCGFLEHPQWPTWLDPARVASVWGSRQLRLLKSIRAVAVTSLDQCIFGATAKKPTTILTVRLAQFRRTVMLTGWGGRCPHPRRHHEALKGKDTRGRYRTASHKIYPPGLNQALAGAIVHFASGLAADGAPRDDMPSAFEPFLVQTYADDDTVQPDYHRDISR